MKKLQIRMGFSVVYVLIGAALCVLTYLGKIQNNDFFSGLGAVFLAVGFVRIVQSLRIKSDPERLRAREIAENDERNITIWEKTRSLTVSVYVVLAGVAEIVLFALNKTTEGQVVAYMLCGFVAVYWICHAIIRSKY